MNTTSAYLVSHQNPAIYLTQTLFTRNNLLTARKAAMSYVEELLMQLWRRGDYTTIIEVRLLCSAEQPITANSPVIALVYQLDLARLQDRSYDEARAVYYAALGQLHEEFMHFQSQGHSMGFGYFQSEVEESDTRELYCHLYDACSYVNQLTGMYENYRQDQNLSPVRLYLTHDDNHVMAFAG